MLIEHYVRNVNNSNLAALRHPQDQLAPAVRTGPEGMEYARSRVHPRGEQC